MDHFVRALSHDMGANLMLLESTLKEVQASCAEKSPVEGLREGLAHAEACLKESKRFLDDLIALGRTGAVQMEPSRVELNDVVAEVLFEQQPLFDARNIEVQVARSLPAVWCNPNRVKQVVTNLVRMRVSYSFTPRIYLQALLQYNDVIDNWSTNLRFNLQQTAATGLYVVYNDTEAFAGAGPVNRAFVIKYVHMWDVFK